MNDFRLLFLINGLGIGNSTRCHAVMQRLHAKGVRIAVMTSGNGLWYFQGRPEVERIEEAEALHYGRGKKGLSVAKTLASTVRFTAILKNNARRVALLLDEFRPHAVVTDSEYTFLPLKRRRIPHIALNNSDVVVAAYRSYRNKPRSIAQQYRFVEQSDYLFHRLIPDLVISPTLDASIPELPGPFVRVGPIVRSGISSTPRVRSKPQIGVMLSGSVFGTPVALSRRSYPAKVLVIGRESLDDAEPPDGVRYLGKVRVNIDLIQDLDLAVVNGGFSAVSEFFAMRKPLVVVPVPNHAEQWINARTIGRLGVGLMADEDSLENTMVAALERFETLKGDYDRLPMPADGAEQAAAIIVERLESPVSLP